MPPSTSTADWITAISTLAAAVFAAAGGDYIPPRVGPPGGLFDDSPNPLRRLGPEDSARWTAKVFGASGFEVTALSVTAEFREAAEVWWRIKPDGRIEEILAPM